MRILGRRRIQQEQRRHEEHRVEQWMAIGKLQLEFMIGQGLQPSHHFLDVGCGVLRAGEHFIRYLEADRYVGFDINAERLASGRAELERNGLSDRNAVLVHTGSFDVRHLDRRFDFAIANSVFTHLPLNTITRCLVRVGDVLSPDGRFYATFFESPAGPPTLEPITHPAAPGTLAPITTEFDSDPFHYEVETFRWVCDRIGLEVEYIGDWGHPRSQRMLVFRRRTA